jgi:hypothetical protein
MYNRGDIQGCAELYRQAAEEALSSAAADDERLLRAGLQQAGRSASAKDAAWALRHAFDDVLDGRGGGSEREAGRKDKGSVPSVHDRIHEAIAVGVPLYNAGDPKTCAQVYEVCLREILPALDSPAARSAQTTLRELGTLPNDDKRAWALRRTMDAILDGSGARNGGGGGADLAQSMLIDLGNPAEASAWKSVNDNVMGGRSTGGMSPGTELGEQCGVFSGVLSTQNNGGFSSVRGPAAGYDLSRYRGLAIEFVGDDRQYKLVVHLDRRIDSPSYQVSRVCAVPAPACHVASPNPEP